MTRDDLEFMRMVAATTGGSPAAAEEEFRREFLRGKVTAAIISKPKLIVVTLDLGAREGPRLVESRSEVFELADRSAGALQTLHRDLQNFVRGANVFEIFLRSSISEKGDYAPHAWHFKIEAALQLVERLTLTFVNTRSVSTWVTHADPHFPERCSLGLGKFWDDKRDLAIETALFVPAKILESRFFWDGSARDE